MRINGTTRVKGAIGLPCPRCTDGQVVERRTKEDDRLFYGCHRFPRCDFAAPRKPLAGKCPECSTPYLLERVMKNGARWAECPDRKCGWKKRLPPDELLSSARV